MNEITPKNYELTPVNKSALAVVISEDDYLRDVLDIDPKADVKTAAGIVLVTDQDNDPSSMIQYAKARVTRLSEDFPNDFGLGVGDVIVYNIGAVVYRDRATAKKAVIVPKDNIIMIWKKKEGK